MPAPVVGQGGAKVKLPMSWMRQILVCMIMYVIVLNKLFRGLIYIGLQWLVGWFAPKPPASSFPPVRHNIIKVSGVRIAEMIRSREITSVEVVQIYINRIKEVNPLVNSMVQYRFDLALEEAARVDDVVSSDLIDTDPYYSLANKPYYGVPITVKEIIFVEGMSATSGMIGRIGHLATEDAAVVKAMKDAGAIVIGVTNTSELAMWWESHNKVYGYSCNPYDLRCIVGGSSGGEAAIIAAAGSVMGIGSDIGGSIRMPAFFNGVFGHKPSPFLVSNEGQFPPATGVGGLYLGLGPICRYADDLEPMLKTMVSKNGPVDFELPFNPDLSKIKFISVEDDGWSFFDGWSVFTSPVDRELKLTQRKVVNWLETSCGAKVERIEIPLLRYSLPIWMAHMNNAGMPKFSQYLTANLDNEHYDVLDLPKLDCFTEFAKKLMGKSNFTYYSLITGILEKIPMAQASVDQLLGMGSELRQVIHTLLDGDTVLLYPPHPMTAPRHHMPCFTGFNFAYTAIWNIIGVPVTQVPMGLDKNGLPLGLQIIGGPNRDRLTIAVARALEKEFGGWVDPEEKYKMYKHETMPRALQLAPKRIVSTNSQTNDARVANGFIS